MACDRVWAGLAVWLPLEAGLKSGVAGWGPVRYAWEVKSWLAGAAVLCGLLHVVVYACLLPLWDGWDEPFHYGYVEALSVRGRLPVMGGTPLSREVDESLHLAPASHVVRQNVPYVITFSEYFALPQAERRRCAGGWRNCPPGGGR